MAKHHMTATVNGDPVEFLCETQDTLLDVLRDQLGLTGTKEGCATGDCGACSVTVDGRLVCSCLMLGVEVKGKSIGTMVDDAALQKLDAAARAACQPIDDKRGTKEYRIKVAGVLARRAAQIAVERARKG